MKSCASAVSAARRSSFRSEPGLPYSMFSATVPWNRKTSWDTRPMARRRSVVSRSRTSCPSSPDDATVDVVESEQQLDHGCLARSRRPHQGDRLPRLCLDRDTLHRRVARGIGEVDTLERNRPLDIFDGQRPTSRRHPRCPVEDVEDPDRRRHRPLVQIERFAKPGKGPQQALCQEDHRGIETRVEPRHLGFGSRLSQGLR